MNLADRRLPTLGEALFALLPCFALLAIGFGHYQLRAEPLMMLCAVIAALVARRLGLTWEDMLEAIVSKIRDAMPALLILISIGFLIGAWMFSGTVPMLIYYGLHLIEPRFLLVTIFVVTSVASTATGTSWGAVGTIGVAFMGIAHGLGVSTAAAAGAVVSGAYFGDKLSPLSDTTNLAPMVAGSELYEHIRHLLYTTLPSTVVALCIYLGVGLASDAGGQSLDVLSAPLEQLDALYDFHPVLLLPLAVVAFGAIRRMPTVPTILLAGTLALALGVVIQGFSLTEGLEAVTGGFEPKLPTPDALQFPPDSAIDMGHLLRRGGMEAMAGPILFVICAFSFAGIVSEAGFLHPLLTRAMAVIGDSQAGLITVTIFATISVAFVTCDAYLTIMIPGDLFRSTYLAHGLHAKNLSRTLEDSGTVIMPLIPWGVSGIYVAQTLDVPTLDYLPWAIFCYLGPLSALLSALTGIGVAPLREIRSTARR